MKEIFLSFRPEYLKPILYGLKKYEYRRKFCDEETIAYLYLSGKSRKVIGIMQLDKPIKLHLTRDDYKENKETLKRVDKYITNKEINAIPIKSLELFKVPITLEDIRKHIPNFMTPQMYYVLNNHKKLKEILNEAQIDYKLFTHSHDKIYYDNLAMSVKEIEKLKEYKRLDSLYKENKKFFQYL